MLVTGAAVGRTTVVEGATAVLSGIVTTVGRDVGTSVVVGAATTVVFSAVVVDSSTEVVSGSGEVDKGVGSSESVLLVTGTSLVGSAVMLVADKDGGGVVNEESTSVDVAFTTGISVFDSVTGRETGRETGSDVGSGVVVSVPFVGTESSTLVVLGASVGTAEVVKGVVATAEVEYGPVPGYEVVSVGRGIKDVMSSSGAVVLRLIGSGRTLSVGSGINDVMSARGVDVMFALTGSGRILLNKVLIGSNSPACEDVEDVVASADAIVEVSFASLEDVTMAEDVAMAEDETSTLDEVRDGLEVVAADEASDEGVLVSDDVALLVVGVWLADLVEGLLLVDPTLDDLVLEDSVLDALEVGPIMTIPVGAIKMPESVSEGVVDTSIAVELVELDPVIDSLGVDCTIELEALPVELVLGCTTTVL